MGLGRDAFGQSHLHSNQHRLFIMLQDQRQNIDHLAIAAGSSQHLVLQLSEGPGQFIEGRTIPGAPGLRWMTAR